MAELDKETRLKLSRDLVRLADLLEDCDSPSFRRELERDYEATMHALGIYSRDAEPSR